jgi:histidyl-tRNA synthetase
LNESRDTEIITPRRLKGFRDALPDDALAREVLLRRIRATFESFGFRPITTPALEHAEILRGKGSDETDRLLFEFRDHGDRAVGMRFDLTVPLARFVAEHQGDLTFPLRVYQIGTVWRGERPQRGRYREFMQCDADIVGAPGPSADAEVISMMHAALADLAVGEFRIRINDRRILNGLLELAGAGGRATEVMRAIDKLEKIGEEGVRAELASLDVDADAISRVTKLFTASGSNDVATIDNLESEVGASDTARAGLESLRTVRALLGDAGVPDGRVQIDPSIARGLDYYTGTVFETTYLPAPDIGSVMSGGRYDHLARLFTKSEYPGVGGSIGIDRLLGAFEVEGRTVETDAQLVVVGSVSGAVTADVVRAAAELRAHGLAVESFVGDKPAKGQRRYAERRGARIVATIDPEQDSVEIIDLKRSQRERVALGELVEAVRRMVAESAS